MDLAKWNLKWENIAEGTWKKGAKDRTTWRNLIRAWSLHVNRLHSSSSVVVVHAWNFREEIIISCQKEKQASKKIMQSNLQNVYIWQKLNREKIEQYLFHHSQTNSTISWPVGELKFIGWESDNHFPYEKYTLWTLL